MREESVYQKEFKDSKAKFFTDKDFGASADGKNDNTVALQKAINSVKEEYGCGILYVPEGTYLLSDTIYIPKAVRIIGYGKTRPKFVLKDNAQGFSEPVKNDKGGYKYLFWFIDRIIKENNFVQDANPGTFYSAMSNVDVKLGMGNEYAVAFRTHYAQHGFLSFIRIEVQSGMAGIYDAGNEIENISIYGGKYAIITTKCSPGWPFLMIDTYFENQTVAAIKTHEAGLTIIRNETKNVSKYIDVDENYFEKIYMENCVIKNVGNVMLNMAMDENSLTQINLKNVLLENVKMLAAFKDSGRCVKIPENGVINYVHGTLISDSDSDRKIVDEVSFSKNAISEDEILKSDLIELPHMKEWVDVTDLGMVGDGVFDNTKIINDIINKHKTLYFPQGVYLFSDTIELKEDTNLLGMHPWTVRLKLMDNSEKFTGIGGRKGFVVAPENGRNIMNGIGVETGGRNPRAVALLWKASGNSYVNDVKLVGGHGNLVDKTGDFENPYNETRTADSDKNRVWDGQYASVIVKNGGGVFKDIWSASPYASAGFQVEDSHVESKVYCMSLEHHQRNELIIRNSSEWSFYALQTEEEMAEGEYALPIEIIDSHNLTFNMAYFFRTIFVKTSLDYCVKCYGSRNIRFNNVHNNSQMKYTITGFLKNYANDTEIRLWQAACANVSVTDDNADDTTEEYILIDEKNVPAKDIKIEKCYEGFRFADAGITDSKGNFYFLDSLDKRVYRIDNEKKDLSVVFESPVKINSVAVDTNDELIFIGEYIIPKGATMNGKPQENILPPDSYGTSYGFWYNPAAVTFAFSITDGEIVPLKKIEIGSMKPELVYYPANRWRDGTDFPWVVQYNPKEAYIANDNKTIIPCHYDLIRANCLTKARPGEKIYSIDELYKRVYECTLLENGLMSKPKAVIEQGDYCVRQCDNKLYVCDDNIKEYNTDGKMVSKYKMPKRPTTIGMDTFNNIKYVTARDAVYVIKNN